MRHLLVIALIVAICSIPAMLSARIYIWTDSEGVKRFSQEPPSDHATEVMVHDELSYDPSTDAKSHGSSAMAHDESSYDPSTDAKNLRGNAAPKSARQPVAASRSRTRIVVENNVILVPATVSYKGRRAQTKLILDTGASSTVLHTALASRLGIRPEMNTKIKVASGNLVDAQAVVLDELRVGPHTMREVRTLIIRYQGSRPNYQGLLGLNFLGRYPYSIDLNAMVINWGADVPAMGP